MTTKQHQPQRCNDAVPTRLYFGKSSPEDFINAKMMDWVYLVGDITTQYELNFVRRFGEAMKASPPSAHQHPKRYFIIEDELKELETSGPERGYCDNLIRKHIAEEVRCHSIPSSTTAPTEEGSGVHMSVEELIARDEYIRSDAYQKGRNDTLKELSDYINEMYPHQEPHGDYMYPSRKGRREVYDQIRDKFLK